MKCPFCDAKLKPFQESCRDCGAALDGVDFEKLVAESKSKRKKVIILSLVFLLLISGGIGVKSFVDQKNTKRVANELYKAAVIQMELDEKLAAEKTAQERRERDDYSWVPKGFTKFSVNYNLAYRGVSYDAANCYTTCFGFQLISKEYCSSARVEADIKRNGVRLDSVSDSAQSVSPQERVIMAMQSSFDSPWNVYFTSATCT